VPRERWPVFRGVDWLHRGRVGGATSDGNTRAVACDIARYTAPRRNSGSGGSNCRATWSTAESGSNPVWTRICRRGAFSAIAEPLARNRRSFPRAAIFVRHRWIYDRHALRRRPTSLSESTRTRIMTPGARQRDRIKCTVVRCRGGVFLAPSGRFQLHSVASVEWDEARNYACMPARSQVRRLPLARLALTRG